MRTLSTFSILFWIYGSRALNNQTNIYARVTLNGRRVNISLKQKIDIRLWDAKRQRIKGNSSTARETNIYLDETKAGLVHCYRDLKTEQRVITPQLIKERFLGEDKKDHSIRDIFKYHNEKTGVKLASKTICHYKTSQKYVLKYILKDFKSPDIYLQNLDYSFLLGFESLLRSISPKHYKGKIGNNAVMKHCKH